MDQNFPWPGFCKALLWCKFGGGNEELKSGRGMHLKVKPCKPKINVKGFRKSVPVFLRFACIQMWAVDVQY